MFSERFRTSRGAHDRHWQSNFWLRLTQVIVAIISLIIATVQITQGDGYYIAAGAYIFYLIVWILTILWSIANFIRLGVSEKPIHPGAIVGLDLVLWILYLIVSIFGFAAFVGTVIIFRDCSSSDYYYDSYYYDDDFCSASGQGLGITALVFEAFGGLFILIAHFYLFVRGCVDVHRRRRSRYQAVQPPLHAIPLNGGYGYVTTVPPAGVNQNMGYVYGGPPQHVQHAQHPQEQQKVADPNYRYVPEAA